MRVPAACQTSEPTLVLFDALSGMATGMWHQVTVQMFGARPRVNVAANALVLRSAHECDPPDASLKTYLPRRQGLCKRI
jgi:hypothetical protein